MNITIRLNSCLSTVSHGFCNVQNLIIIIFCVNINALVLLFRVFLFQLRPFLYNLSSQFQSMTTPLLTLLFSRPISVMFNTLDSNSFRLWAVPILPRSFACSVTTGNFCFINWYEMYVLALTIWKALCNFTTLDNL